MKVMKTQVKLMTICARATAIILLLDILIAIITVNPSNMIFLGGLVAVLVSAVGFLGTACYVGIVYWLQNRDNPKPNGV